MAGAARRGGSAVINNRCGCDSQCEITLSFIASYISLGSGGDRPRAIGSKASRCILKVCIHL